MSTPPLVVDCGDSLVWIQNGMGWQWHEGHGWLVLTEAQGIGGRVLSAAEVEVVRAGRGAP